MKPETDDAANIACCIAHEHCRSREASPQPCCASSPGLVSSESHWIKPDSQDQPALVHPAIFGWPSLPQGTQLRTDMISHCHVISNGLCGRDSGLFRPGGTQPNGLFTGNATSLEGFPGKEIDYWKRLHRLGVKLHVTAADLCQGTEGKKI